MSEHSDSETSCGCNRLRSRSWNRERRAPLIPKSPSMNGEGWKSKFTKHLWARCSKRVDPSSSPQNENRLPPAEALPLIEAVPPETDELYLQWFTYEMSLRFPRIDSTDLRVALRSHEGSLCRAYKAVAISYADAVRKEQNSPMREEECREQQSDHWPPPDGLRLLESSNCDLRKFPDTGCPKFEREWATLKVDLSEPLKEDQLFSPLHIIDCGCCCMEYQFDEMVQVQGVQNLEISRRQESTGLFIDNFYMCSYHLLTRCHISRGKQCAEGHLFCGSCLRRQVEELTFGGLQTCGRLPCMDTVGCDEFFPCSEIQRTIPKDLLIKFEQRQAADSVAKARLSGLEHCPFCNFVCEVDKGRIIFNCPNEHCLKASCIVCKEPDHSPLGCKEVEKPSDTCSRTKIEEIMSKALIRECSRCKAQIVKEDGCNKVTCRCGQSMCYICRKQVVTYEHFCAHLRTDGTCTHCKKSCHLHDKEDSKTVIRQAKGVAINALAWKDPAILTRQIGPAEHISHKS